MTATASSTDEPGLGRYELIARTSQGPRGPVFVACAAAAATVELYLIEASAFGPDDDAEAFVHSVAAAARIYHRNVLPIAEHGPTSTGHYAVSPYLDACTLADLEARYRTQRPPHLVIAAIVDALHGLHAAHTQPEPLIHGSVSPDQLMVGVDGVCRVTGFGRGRPRGASPAGRAIAAGYLSPEQLAGGAADARSDVFAIGVVLWSALTGKRLFHDPIEALTVSNVLERQVPRPSMIGLASPAALDAVVMKALERDPARRFQSAGEMAEALREAGRAAGCFATAPELGAWVAAAFGNELANRRRAIHALAAKPEPEGGSIPMLPRLVLATVAAATARDYLSLDELARAHDPMPAGDEPLLPAAAQPVMLRAPSPMIVSRRPPLALLAAFAVAMLVGVLGWRLLAPRPASPPPATERQPRLDVTVLDVRAVPPPAAGSAAAH